MRVLFVTSEVAGLFKLGGLADVSRSLPIALHRLGVSVTVILPYYKDITLDKPHCLGTLAVTFDKRRELVFVFGTKLAGTSVPVLLLRHPMLEHYHDGSMETRFALFSLAIVALVGQAKSVLGNPVNIVHCHDWHTSLVPLLLGENNKILADRPTVQARASKTILTIHNLLYQGVTGAEIINLLGLPKRIFHILPREGGDVVNILREALEYADVISTVSPTYAKEITRPAHGIGLHEVFRRRRDSIVGILNGIDTVAWNPATDDAVALRFDRQSAHTAKPKLKALLQKELGLTQANLPVFAFIGRIEPRQKGIDILVSSLTKLLPGRVMQMVILGTGDSKVGRSIRALMTRYRDDISFVNAFNDPLARRIYAGADVLLVPSKFEPCGLTQMIAMRYGTIPLVRKTGGLVDTVVDGRTGFTFRPYTASALTQAIERAIKFYHEKPALWKEMVARAMREDFSWTKSARKYRKLYHSLLQKA